MMKPSPGRKPVDSGFAGDQKKEQQCCGAHGEIDRGGKHGVAGDHSDLSVDAGLHVHKDADGECHQRIDQFHVVSSFLSAFCMLFVYATPEKEKTQGVWTENVKTACNLFTGKKEYIVENHFQEGGER